MVDLTRKNSYGWQQYNRSDFLKQYISDRVLAEATYVLQHNATVRQTAAAFDVSKSTTHKDLTERLANLSATLHDAVSVILAENWDERYLRGGEATKQKYDKLR